MIEANFSGRDELQAAAESLDDEARQRACRRAPVDDWRTIWRDTLSSYSRL